MSMHLCMYGIITIISVLVKKKTEEKYVKYQASTEEWLNKQELFIVRIIPLK